MFGAHNAELKITLTQAAEESRELGGREIGAGHLLVAMLTNVRGSAYQVLTAHDLEYTGARARLADYLAEQPATGRADATDDSTLEADREALRRIGIDLDAVRSAVQERFGTDITQGWGRRRPRRGERDARGPAGRHGRGRPDGRGPGASDGRGRRGPQSHRPARLRFTDSLREAMNDLREELREEARAGGRPDREEFGRRIPLHLLLTLLESDDPAVAAVLGDTAADQVAETTRQELELIAR